MGGWEWQGKACWPWTDLSMHAQVSEEAQGLCVWHPPTSPCSVSLRAPSIALPSVSPICLLLSPWLCPSPGQCQLSPRLLLPSSVYSPLWNQYGSLKTQIWSCHSTVRNSLVASYYTWGKLHSLSSLLRACTIASLPTSPASGLFSFPVAPPSAIAIPAMTVCTPWSSSHHVSSARNIPFLPLFWLSPMSSFKFQLECDVLNESCLAPWVVLAISFTLYLFWGF